MTSLEFLQHSSCVNGSQESLFSMTPNYVSYLGPSGSPHTSSLVLVGKQETVTVSGVQPRIALRRISPRLHHFIGQI